jgi:hypothetical protein
VCCPGFSESSNPTLRKSAKDGAPGRADFTCFFAPQNCGEVRVQVHFSVQEKSDISAGRDVKSPVFLMVIVRNNAAFRALFTLLRFVCISSVFRVEMSVLCTVSWGYIFSIL